MASVRAAAVAGGQWGVIGWEQLRNCGVGYATASEWRAAGRLHPIHRAVFAWGHRAIPVEGRLVAAILHGDPGAALSHRTAAWWWGLIPDEPTLIEISTTSRARSTDGVRVHHPRHLRTIRHRRFPITTVGQTLLDLAAYSSLNEVRQALAEADYRRILDVGELQQLLGPGRAGSRTLRQALDRHEPRLARTRSELERRFLALCEHAGLPLPEVNYRIGRMKVDAVWPAHRLAVELDGYEGHHTRAQRERDRRRELHARFAGYELIRYSSDQVFDEPDLVAADLSRQLNSAERSAGSGSR